MPDDWCDAWTYDVPTNTSHRCGLDYGHAGAHECEACSEEWEDRSQGSEPDQP